MKRYIVFFFFLSFSISAQNIDNNEISSSNQIVIPKDNQVKIKLDIGVENIELKTYYEFENIEQFKFNFESDKILGKAYVLRLKEFFKGELINTKILFDERKSNFFKINSNPMSFKILTKIDDKAFKFWLRGQNFGSKKSIFTLKKENVGTYVAKNFIGSRKNLINDYTQPFYLLAVITPYITKSGAGQYCKVAYSDIHPEKFGEHFGIPHYYLIEMEFVD